MIKVFLGVLTAKLIFPIIIYELKRINWKYSVNKNYGHFRKPPLWLHIVKAIVKDEVITE